MTLAVVPVLVGPLQVLLAMLPAILAAVFTVLVSLFKPSAMKQGVKLLWRLKVQVILIALVVAGGWMAFDRYWPKSSLVRGDAGQAEAGADWPLFRGSLARTGVVAGSPEPTSGDIRWTFKGEGGEAFLSSPAVVGNRVYFTTGVIEPGGTGRIVCLDADTGTLAWVAAPKDPDDYEATFSSPSISGEYLVVGEGLHDTTDARIVCISLAPGREGQILWTHRTQSHVESTPVIHDGKVYVGAGDKEGYYCLALEGDGNGNSKVIWQRRGPQYQDAETSLVAYGNRFYAGLGNEGKALVEFDADTGDELRRIPTEYPVFSPPAIADGKLYVGSGNGDFAFSASQLGLQTAGKLLCVDLETFTVDWQLPVPDTILGSPAVHGGSIYITCRDGIVRRVSLDGRITASWDTGDELMTSPAVSEQTLYVVSRSGMILAWDLASGRRVWECTIGNPPGPNEFGYISSPAVARGRVYVGTQKFGFVCAGQPGEPRKTVWSGPRGGHWQGVLNQVQLPSLAVLAWQWPETPPADGAAVQAPPALVGRLAVVPVTGMGKDNGVVCMQSDSAAPEILWRAPAPLGVVATPVAIADAKGQLEGAIFVDGHKGQAGRRLVRLDGEGKEVWTVPVAPAAEPALWMIDGRIYAQTESDTSLSCLDLDGKRLWIADCGGPVTRIAAAESLLAAARSDAIVLLDRLTGLPLQTAAVSGSRIHDLTWHKGRLLALTDKGLQAVPLAPGDKAEHLGPPGLGAATFSGSKAWYVSDGKLVAVDLDEGTREVLADASAAADPLLVAGSILYTAPDGSLQTRPLAPAKEGEAVVSTPLCNEDMSWLGQWVTRPVVANGRVFLATKEFGLCVLKADK